MIPEIEKTPIDEIKGFQEKKLRDLLVYLNGNSQYYKKHFAANNININDISTLEDLREIPVTDKDDLQKHFDEFLCVEKSSIIDFVTTSGTLGEAVTFAMTENDLNRLAYNEYLSFLCANSSADDIFQLMVTLDKRFMAGMAYFLGLRKLGAGIIRMGPGSQKLQFDSIKRFSPSGLVCVPSFITKMISYAEENRIDINSLSVKKAVCIGEPIRNDDFSLNALGKKINDKWGIKLYSTYASTEMGTAFTECEAGKGGHHHPEMIIVEFLDKDNNPVPEGSPGEVTITTLGVEAMPLLRFKTGDICNRHSGKCSCGRTTMRLGPVIGRRKQMLKLKGTTLFPPAIYNVLNQLEFVVNYIVEVSTNELGIDRILVKAGVRSLEKYTEKTIKDHFRSIMRVAPEIELLPPQEITALQFAEGGRKPRIFHDYRNTKNL
ncbi:MAG: phenylacetate--CoA ligase [Chlorobi bacterium]|nr:phenylacetate--CoA ligase [Chlorobiota bacterium]